MKVEVAENLGYDGLEAFDGQNRARAFQAAPGSDLLITHLRLLGGVNGRPAADATLSMKPSPKVLFITGHVKTR